MTDEEEEVEARLQASESLRQDGFLSPWIEKFVPHFRQSNQDWSDYARDMNRCGLEIATATDDVVVGKSTHDPVCIAYRLLLRALTDFQAAVTLAERGIISEADTLTRGIYEAGFWMGYLQNDGANAANAMLQDSIASGLGALKFERKLALKAYGESSDEVREIDQAITARGRGKAQNIADLAFSSGYENYYPIYKELSSSVAHTSLHSLHSLMKDNGDGTYDGHIVGPDEAGIEPAMSKACLALCLNLRAYSELVGETELDPQLQNLLLRWDEMASRKKGYSNDNLEGTGS
jgi:Family of unknown function (DUF5677)